MWVHCELVISHIWMPLNPSIDTSASSVILNDSSRTYHVTQLIIIPEDGGGFVSCGNPAPPTILPQVQSNPHQICITCMEFPENAEHIFLTCIANCIHYKVWYINNEMWNQITDQFPPFNGATVEVWFCLFLRPVELHLFWQYYI